jgi:hypothetical protein
MKQLRIPVEWRMCIMMLLFKKGDKKDPGNYRGINLFNTTLQLTTEEMKDKINTIISLAEEQQDFRSGRSCTGAIFIMRQYNKPVYLSFIDLQKAFDRVQLRYVIPLLHDR